MKINITPKNKKGQPHGLWELYLSNGQLYFKGNYINGQAHGLWEWYHSNGKLESKEYYI